MMRLLLVFGVFVLAVAAPASARTTQAAEPALATILDDQMTAYGQWLAQIQDIEAPLQRELGQLGALWRDTMAASRGAEDFARRMRLELARIARLIESTNRQIDALERPVFAELELDPDITTERIAGDMVEINRQMGVVIESFEPFFEAAIRNDAAAIDAAIGRILGSLQLVFESQIVVTRASIAATPRDESAWELGNFQLLFFRAGSRLFGALRPSDAGTIDPTLADDLAGIARELEQNADRGEPKLQSELQALEESLAEAEADRDSATAALLRRAIAVLQETSAYFPLSREFARALRFRASDFRARPVTPQTFMPLAAQLRETRTRIDEIGAREAAVMGDD